MVAICGNDRNTNILILADTLDRLLDSFHHRYVNHVINLRTIQSDDRNVVFDLKQNSIVHNMISFSI